MVKYEIHSESGLQNQLPLLDKYLINLRTQTFIEFTNVLNFRECEIVEEVQEHNMRIQEASSEQEENVKEEVVQKKVKPTFFMKLVMAI